MPAQRPALRLAIIGDPVAHSRSPALHRAFLDEAAIAGTYEAIRVESGAAAAAIDALRAAGYQGLNVTTPLKEEAYARSDVRDAGAQAAGAANTLLLHAGGIAAYNTDGIAAIGALRAAGLGQIAGARVLLLGAGPTARAVLAALTNAGAEVTIWNRTPANARALTEVRGACAWRGGGGFFDVAFSTLPPDAELADPDLRADVNATRIAIDANYGARATLGQRLGRSDVSDGSRMLACGARASFELFRTLADH